MKIGSSHTLRAFLSRKKKLLGALGLLITLFMIWVVISPPGTFGWCRFGLTTYSSVPYPGFDIQVRGDGDVRRVQKTHELKLSEIEWLLDPRPDVLIISTGWQGAVRVGDDISQLDQCAVEMLNTGEAIQRYRELKKRRKKVSIHVHSTC